MTRSLRLAIALAMATLVGAAGSRCGDCLPKTDPAPDTVNCLAAGQRPIESCTCVKKRCIGGMTLL
jgi:hypothetical protein